MTRRCAVGARIRPSRVFSSKSHTYLLQEPLHLALVIRVEAVDEQQQVDIKAEAHRGAPPEGAAHVHPIHLQQVVHTHEVVLTCGILTHTVTTTTVRDASMKTFEEKRGFNTNASLQMWYRPETA